MLRGHGAALQSIRFSRDDRELIAAGEDGRVLIWDLETRRHKELVPPHEHVVWSAVYSPNGKMILTASGDGTVRWSHRDGTKIRDYLDPHDDWPRSASFSPDGTQVLATWSDSTVLRRLDLDGNLTTTLQGPGIMPPTDSAFSPKFSEDRRIAFLGGDNGAQIWHIDDSPGPVLPHGGLLGSVAFHPDATRVLSGEANSRRRRQDRTGCHGSKRTKP